MNDFTKEELEDLESIVRHVCCWPDEILKNLGFKLQSLIDNYCEHEWINGYCEKCNRSPIKC